MMPSTPPNLKNRWTMQTIPDPCLEQALILQAITPCTKEAVWLCETKQAVVIIISFFY